MELLFTEFSKGRKKFEKMFFNGVIDPKGFVQSINDYLVKEILSTGESKFLNDLDAIGEHFRKSWRTRHTGHKKNDFSSLQIQSSVNLQKFYSDIIAAQKGSLNKLSSKSNVNMVPVDTIMDTTLGKGVLAYQKKIQKAAKDLISAVSENKEMEKMVEDKLQEIRKTGNISEYKKYLDESVAALSDNVKFVNDESQRIVANANDTTAILGITGVGAAAVTSLPELVALGIGTSLALFAPNVGSMIAIADAAFIAAAGVGMGILGVGAGFAAVVLIAALALFCANALGVTKRLAIISVKRYVTKIKSKLRDIIRYTNDAEKFVNNYLKTKQKSVGLPTEITDDIKTIVNDFIKKQKTLWIPYTTSAGREYFEELKAAHGKHWSGIRKVLDNKESTEIGAAKLALATVWTKMVVAL